MRKLRRSQWLFAAVLSALLVIAMPSVAPAQNQINASGHARDANPQMGSGGMNTPNPLISAQQYQPGVVGNLLVSGNVSNGKSLQISNSIPPPNAWQGRQPLAGVGIDQFTQNSTGVPLPHSIALAPNTSVPFFAQSQIVTAPAGFVQPPNVQGGFVPQQMLVSQGIEDQRILNGPDTPVISMPHPGQLILPGATANVASQGDVVVGSPLYGLKELNVTGNQADQSFLQRYGNQQENSLDRLQLDSRTIQKMRDELRSAPPDAVPQLLNQNNPNQLNQNNPNGSNDLNGTNGTNNQSGLNGNGNQQDSGQQSNPPGMLNGMTQASKPLQSSTPLNVPLANRPYQSQLSPNQPTQANDLGTQQGYESRSLNSNAATPGAQQSRQYGKMRDLLQRFNANHANAQQAEVAAYNAQMQARNANGQGSLTPPPPAVVGTNNEPGPMLHPEKVNSDGASKNGAVGKPAPLIVQSLATDVKAKGMHDVLQKAEDLMKAGKFTTAIDEYNTAEVIAAGQPIQSLVWIGRANAELGAGYYSRASAQLEEAFALDPSLLMAQYDLRTLIGAERLEAIVKDLKEQEAKNTKSATPLFLLAYISYNTGNERRAAAFLDLAEKRAGAKTEVYKLLREHWSLPTDTEPAGKDAPLNK